MDGLPPGLDPRLAARARRAAAWVHQQRQAGRTVTVVHHIDADGVSAGAVAATALERSGTPFVLLPVKSLDDLHLGLIRDAMPQALWFCDLGSTAYMHFPHTPRLVCDHHQLVRDGGEESFPHLNPLLDGLDGQEVSGAGCTYLVAAALDARNTDQLPLALVGATADRQDRPALHGTNARLLRHAEDLGMARSARDLAFFGPNTRPLRKFLALASDPQLPGLSGNATVVERFLRDAQVDLEVEGAERTWAMLSDTERTRVRSALANHLLDLGLAAEAERLVRPVITLPHEPAGPTRELQEFGTLLNSTARYDRPDVGIALARGDRSAAYAEALDLLQDHRKHLVGALEAFARGGVQERPSLQWVHLRDSVRDTVVGIVAGMALGGALDLRKDRPLIAFAWSGDGRTKVSSRAPHELKGRIDLSLAMRQAAASVGGEGGGHPGAAGATIPRGAEERFLAAVERVLEPQLGILPAPVPAWVPRKAGQSRLLPFA
ncbi:MAG TPA: DHH family phosphoesterase [Candidatus Thermoplasmatota archaeon]|nr:DHH family phosphoesterase [Candidatus Thermoplasmatota archaeon]